MPIRHAISAQNRDDVPVDACICFVPSCGNT